MSGAQHQRGAVARRRAGEPRAIFPRIAIAATMLCALFGCASEADQSAAAHDEGTAACPQWLTDRLSLSVSAVPASIPARLAIMSGTVPFEGAVGRRVLVALAASGDIRRVRVSDSVLTLSTFGGILADWAARSHRGVPEDGRGYSIAVNAGQLLLQPFLRSGSLASQTSEFDIVVIPGGVPLDEVTISTSNLWSPELRAEPPGAVHIRLSPVEHMTVLDRVNAAVQLDFLAGRGRRARERWRCSVSTRADLVDHDAELPPLWVLRTVPRRGTPSVLALYTPTAGPFRAIFTSPEIAAGFAQWLRETTATRIDIYELGLLMPPDDLHNRRPNESIGARFHSASVEDLDVLRVSRLDAND